MERHATIAALIFHRRLKDKMNDIDNLKIQRDRFLAFAFASADLMLEVDPEGKIIYALGAAKAITTIDHQTLEGHNWLSIFHPSCRSALTVLTANASNARRCGPLSVTMDEQLGNSEEAIITAIKMPDDNNLYITIGFINTIMADLSHTIKMARHCEILDRQDFIHSAQSAFDLARAAGQNIDVTLLDFDSTTVIEERMKGEPWEQFTEALSNLLGSYAIDGQTAGEITKGRYGVIHDSNIDTGALCDEVEMLSKESDPKGEGFLIEGKTITSDLRNLAEHDAMKAFVYTIHEFERNGTKLSIENLNTGFEAYVSANTEKIQQIKSMIKGSQFDFSFHAVVDLKSQALNYFEILTSFHAGGSTREWAAFAEDINMSTDFDLAVCDRVINYLLYKSSGHSTKFAVNLSGKSIQSEPFFKALMLRLTKNPDLSNRLIFEITDSTAITDLEMMNHFIKKFQEQGFEICLDDFGTGASSLQTLQQLHVDYVKIAGSYTQKILTSSRDEAILKNMAQMCDELGIKVIAERIETKEQLLKLKNMGIEMGQGYYFSEIEKTPSYDPPSTKNSKK